jgi:hypothetical protein
VTLSIQGIRLPWTVIQAGVELVFITRPVLRSQSQNQNEETLPTAAHDSLTSRASEIM